MKRILISSVLALGIPLSSLAVSFERDLFFGMQNDPSVRELQEFLLAQKLYSGPLTGGFFSLTRDAVKKFQEREGIIPAFGFFGPRTRERAHKLMGGGSSLVKPLTAADILQRITVLQSQLKTVQEKLAQETIPPVVPSVETTTTVATTTPEIVPPPKEVRVSGASTSTFPAIADFTPYKIGEFLIGNSTASDVLFSNFEVRISDEMDSYLNRNRRVFFILRNGPTELDELVSRTLFRFITTPPAVGAPHKSFLILSYPKTVKAGESQKVSLWIEQLDYVRSGTLIIETSKISTTLSTAPAGEFRLVLTKEPPL